MELHEEVMRAITKIPFEQLVSALAAPSPLSPGTANVAEPLHYITSIWEEYLVLNGERVIGHRVFIKHESSGTLAKIGWLLEETHAQCVLCSAAFGIFNARSHCRTCGNLICQRCKRQAFIEGMEVHGTATVCCQCCWGQEFVPIANYSPSSGVALIIRDLPCSVSYAYSKVNPCYVMCTATSYTPAGSTPVFINLCTSTVIPSRLTGTRSSFAIFCGCQRKSLEHFMVFDIILNPMMLVSTGKHQDGAELEFDHVVHEQVIYFIERFFHTRIGLERTIRHDLVYFEPNKALNEQSFMGIVLFPIPPVSAFDKYTQVPLFDGDRVRVEEERPGMPGQHSSKDSSGIARSASGSAASLDETVNTEDRHQLGITNHFRNLPSGTSNDKMPRVATKSTSKDSAHYGSSKSTPGHVHAHAGHAPAAPMNYPPIAPIQIPVVTMREPIKGSPTTTTPPGSTAGKGTPTHAALPPAPPRVLTKDCTVNFADPHHMRSVVSIVGHDEKKAPPTHGSGLRAIQQHKTVKEPAVLSAGLEGRGMLTREMLEVNKDLSIDNRSATDLMNDSKKDRSLLIGWQVMVYNVDRTEMKGVYVVTGERRLHGQQLYRLSNFEEADQWVRLSKKKNSKGFPYQPLRLVL